MKSLRVIKDRATESKIENDLRGLGHDPLLQDSENFSFLAVKNVDQQTITSVVTAFNLECDHVQNEKISILRCKKEGKLNQKEQTIYILGAAIVLKKKSNQGHFYCDVTSGLKIHLEKEIHNTNQSVHEPMEKIKHWIHSEDPFVLSVPVQIHLNSAGFPVEVTNEAQKINNHQLEQLFNTLTQHQQNQRTGTEKTKKTINER